MGDKALRYFSQIENRDCVKMNIIARYGGDEFVMILTDASLENAESVLLRLKMNSASGPKIADCGRSQFRNGNNTGR